MVLDRRTAFSRRHEDRFSNRTVIQESLHNFLDTAGDGFVMPQRVASTLYREWSVNFRLPGHEWCG
jgi:hypothetical protein